MSARDFIYLCPFLVPLAGALAVLMLDGVNRKKDDYWSLGVIAFVMSLGTGAWFLSYGWAVGSPVQVFSALRLDGLAVFAGVMVSFCTAVVALLCHEYLRRENIPPGAFYSLLLIAAHGLILLAACTDWIAFFVCLEIASVPLYILSGVEKRHHASREAALKFFLLGAVAGALVLYGIAFIFGATGTTAMRPDGPLSPQWSAYLLIGAPLLLAGLCFKLGVAPMHFWAPDTFEGAPTPLVAFIATASKVGVFVALVRVLAAFAQPPLQSAGPSLVTLLYWIALISMIFGNVMAVVQTQIKRMLAYSSIAHGGYMLVAYVVLAGAGGDGARAALVYLAAYCMMTLAAFSVLVALGRQGDRDMAQYTGLFERQPWPAIILTLALLSMTGIPLTVGFIGKYAVFVTAARDYLGLVLIALLTSVIAAYYYIKLLVYMYMRPEMGMVLLPQSYGYRIRLALVVTALSVVGFGILPQSLLSWIGALAARIW